MIGFAAPRPLRAPALAVLAMVGLVAWGAAGPCAAAAWSAPSRDAISAVEQIQAAALVSGAPQVGALAESTDRPRPRTAGAAPRGPNARSEAARLVLPTTSRSPDASLSNFLARTRAGRETAPSTGPPSLPF